MANENDLVTNNCIHRRCYVCQTIGLCHTYLVLNFGWRGVKLLSHSIVNNSSRANVNASEVVCRRRGRRLAGPTYQNSKNITPKIKTLKHDIYLLLLIRQMMSQTSIVVFEVIQHIKNVLNWSEENWTELIRTQSSGGDCDFFQFNFFFMWNLEENDFVHVCNKADDMIYLRHWVQSKCRNLYADFENQVWKNNASFSTAFESAYQNEIKKCFRTSRLCINLLLI